MDLSWFCCGMLAKNEGWENVPKLIGTFAEPAELATLPKSTERLAIRQKQIDLQEEVKAGVVEVKHVSSYHQLM